MKKFTILLLILASIFSLNGCATVSTLMRAVNNDTPAAESSTAEIEPQIAASSQTVEKDSIVYFEDPLVEAVVRNHLHKSEGDIMNSELKDITILSFAGDKQAVNAFSDWGEEVPSGVVTVNDLKKFPNLTGLEISFQEDFDPENLWKISELEGLTILQLAGVGISDLTPLARLANLTELGLDCNAISDISPLADLENLENLYLRENNIIDLSPLAGLENLQTLLLEGNPVSDWTPVEHVADVGGRDGEGAAADAPQDEGNTQDAPVNPEVLDCLDMTLEDVAQANGGTLPAANFQEDELWYFQAVGLYDTYLGFSDPDVYEWDGSGKVQCIITSCISAFYEQSVSVDWLREKFGASLAAEEDDDTVNVDAELNGIVYDFYAESVNDDSVTNLIIYRK